MLPLHIVILRILKRSNGTATDKELFRAVKKILGDDISRSQFNKMLMVLEVRGMVIVEPLKKDLKIVRLVS
ncbi:MAG: hypothetical protein DRJ37_04995 [Thermoprotei archaeon]|nr:MAG: hypothetical protein DRJ37_04995 [Thermoprotei archaeon]